jgi:hypothetical protein
MARQLPRFNSSVFFVSLGDYYISRVRAEPAFSRRSAPALAQRTGGNLLLCVSPCRRAKWGTR